MILKPPPGSKISVTTEGSDPVIAVPSGGGGAMRYFVGLFLLFWLGGWFVGFSDVFTRLLTGKANTFLFFWLGGWTLAGIAVVFCLYRIFRPSVPESLRLMLNGVRYDSGVPPFQTSFASMNQKSWTSLFPTRMRVEIDRRQLRTLRLRETGAGNRLTVDAGAQRIDIGKWASEVEREWLYQVLAKRYSLPSEPADAGGRGHPA
ncbi:MAG TPA: hypothetical protein VFB88_10200 [Xanthobacteraceae bacterium]|nr:hypothetical protein [Xanthobacteraceae bacterium]